MRVSGSLLEHRLILPAVAALALAGVALFALAGAISQDEGFYLQAGRRVYDGEMLYRDFPYFQAPLAPYIYGIPQTILGPSLYAGRATAAAFVLAAMALTAFDAMRLGGRAAALIAIVLLLVTPQFMLYGLQARSEAIVTPFVVLSAILALRLQPGWRLLLFPAMAMLAASLVRVNLLPVAAIVFAFCAWRTGGDRVTIAAGGLIVLLIVAWSPFLVADIDATVFNVVTSQDERQIQFSVGQAGLPSQSARDRYIDRMEEVARAWTGYFHLLVPALAGVAAAATRLRSRDAWHGLRPHVDASMAISLLIILAFVVWLPNVTLYRQEARYIVPAVPLLALAVAMLVSGAADHSAAIKSQHRVLLTIAVAFWLPLAVALGLASIDPDESVVETNRFASEIAAFAPGPGNVVTLDPTIPVGAGASAPRELTMGLFSYWPFMAEADLDRYHLVNRRRLEELMLAPDTKAIVLSGLMQYIVTSSSAPSDSDLNEPEGPFRTFPRLKEHYELVATNGSALGVRTDIYWLLVRKE